MGRFLTIVLVGAMILAPFTAGAQTAASVAARQQELQNQLDQIEQQIAVQQKLLDATQGQSKTLQSQINAFDAAIKKTQLQIQAINLTIKKLSGDIGTHNDTLASLSDKRDREAESLAQIMRQTQMLDNYSIVDVALSSKGVSDFFSDLDAFVSIKTAMAASFDEIKQTSAATAAERDALEVRLEDQQSLRSEAQLAQQQVKAQEAEKQALLKKTKGIEANYQKLIASNRQTAAQIRSELFALAGGGGRIPLPTAILLAKQAGDATGVRPAFILAILKQETNLGANVGQCLLTNDPKKGDGKGKNTGRFFDGVMKPTRDVDPFMKITAALGLDPYSMPVSCPPSYGYGGAMGAGQFIPSTWVLYEKRVAKLAGHPNKPANPWDNLDAFTAVALYMTDLGATKQTYTAERTAALKYFAGGNWNKSAYAFYGDGVMGFAKDFQEQIDILGGS